MNKLEILDIRVFGGLEIRCGTRRLAFPTRHSALLLPVLALSPGGCIGREACAALFWGGRGDEQARASLRQAIYHTQKVLNAAGAAPLVASRQEVSLEPGCWRSDAGMLQDILQDDPVAAAELYRGELLVRTGRMGPEFEDWVRMEQQAIAARLISALAPAADAAFESGALDRLESISAALLRLDPLNEKALRQNMVALSGLNRRPSALKAFQSFETALLEDLGLTPEPETVDLWQRLQSGAQTQTITASDTPTDLDQPQPDFRERCTISLVLLRPSMPIRDPEEIAQWLADASAKLADGFGDRQVDVMLPIGASLACVFGARQDTERHSEEAAIAALTLNKEFNEKARLAVVSGDIVLEAATSFTPDRTSAIAHLVEEAAALADASPAGKPVASSGVAARLGLPYRQEAPGRILQENDLLDAGQVSSTFLARQTEFAELSEAFEATRAGYGRVVGVMGEAGIGKSSLVTNFVTQRQIPAVYLDARSRESDRPYSAATRLFRTLLSPLPGEPLEDAITRAVTLGKLSENADYALRDLLGLPVQDSAWVEAPPGLRRRLIHQLAVSMITRLTRDSAAVLVAEDLHWMDPESLSLLDRLIDELSALPLLVIATYRPEFKNDWIGRSFFRLIRVRPLSNRDAHELLGFVLLDNKLDASERTAIVNRCGGVPYFLVETARAMERGEALPASIRDVLAAHVQTLPPRERFVLQCAAIFGMEVEATQIVSLIRLQEDELDTALAHLRKEELLQRQPGSAALKFRHALLHDTVYASIPHQDRVRLHSAAMDLFLSATPKVRSDLIPIIAHHALHAERWKEAVDWFIRAGDRFAELSSYELASHAYSAANGALGKLIADEWSSEKHIEISLKQRPVMVPLGRYENALSELDRAEEEVKKIQNPVLSASVEIGKSYLFSTHGRLDEAVAYAHKAANSAPPDHQTSVEAKLALGQALSLMGDWKSTITTLKTTLPFWETHQTQRFGHTGTRAVWCHGHLAHAFALNANFPAALNHAEQSFALAAETGRPLDLLFALHRLGEVFLAMGDVDEAISKLEDANAWAEEIGAPIFQVWFACDIVPAYLSFGRLEEARRFLSRQHTMANRLQLNQFLAWLILRRAELALMEGNPNQAVELADTALRMAREIPDLVLEPEALIVKSRCKNNKGALLRKAQRLVDERGLLILSSKLP